MDNNLWKIFDNVNSWLKYAENKNTYILAFIGAQVTLIKLLDSQTNGRLITSFVFLGLCFLVCIFSFFPKTIISSWLYYVAKSHQKPDKKDNLLFYGHIAKYSVNQYKDEMARYLNQKIEGNKYLEDLCGQIVINAGIAHTKFSMFKISFWLMLLGQVFFLLSLIG